MKSLENTIYLIEKAIKSVPDSETDIKNRLKATYRLIQTLINKRPKQETLTPNEKWKFDLETSKLTYSNPIEGLKAKEVLQAIEDMIVKEEGKLKENEKPKTILG